VELFHIMLDRNIPPVVTKFLLKLYSEQYACINWNSTLSLSFTISNGVRQGDISDPILICLYTDGLLRCLKEARVGCYIGSIYIRVLVYADDLTLLVPTASAARMMLHIVIRTLLKILFVSMLIKLNVYFRPA
jgi:hypothetical protein